ncbi:MAG: hypothetical protein RDV41_08820 [Planctomycetota bacterium]|nr:hypothetical protein [Planctomycetota bacterium]
MRIGKSRGRSHRTMAGGVGFPPGRPRRESGGGLVLAILLMVLLPLLMSVVQQSLITHGEAVEMEHTYRAQAISIAQAGLVDALSWFRRQTVQPVTVFNPQFDPDDDPPLLDTDLPGVGLVRSLPLSTGARRWGRYVVQNTTCRDITAERGLTGNGIVWYLQSTGIIFGGDPDDLGLKYIDPPPDILLRTSVATEIRRLAMNLPINAGILCGSTGASVNIAARAKVAGGALGFGVGYKTGTGAPTVAGEATGIEGLKAVDPGAFDTSVFGVFAVTQEELFQMADISVGTVNDLPNPYPAMALVCIQGDAVFDEDRPLTGGGMLYVTGDLSVSGNSSFSGFIFVEGDYDQRATAVIYGSIVVNGAVTVAGVGGDFTEVFFDNGALETVRMLLGRYRISKPPHIVEMQCSYCFAQGVHVLYCCSSCGRTFCERDYVENKCPNCNEMTVTVIYRY